MMALPKITFRVPPEIQEIMDSKTVHGEKTEFIKTAILEKHDRDVQSRTVGRSDGRTSDLCRTSVSHLKFLLQFFQDRKAVLQETMTQADRTAMKSTIEFLKTVYSEGIME